ncbi:MAG: hypothetical protein LBM19_02720 [Holosporales bacterium]|nr:hypothetical protein [Holosporales bacterium]
MSVWKIILGIAAGFWGGLALIMAIVFLFDHFTVRKEEPSSYDLKLKSLTRIAESLERIEKS